MDSYGENNVSWEHIAFVLNSEDVGSMFQRNVDGYIPTSNYNLEDVNPHCHSLENLKPHR
jgi:hypothetical protein